MKDRRKKGLSGLVLLSMLCTNVLPVYAQEAVLPEQPVAYTQAEELKAEDLVVKPLTDVLLGEQSGALLEGLTIKGIFKSKAGQDIINPFTGEVVPGTAESVIIDLDYEGENSELYEISKRISEFSIDGRTYRGKDEKGLRNILLVDGDFAIYDKYPEGVKVVSEFKENQPHKVVVKFDNGEELSYKDDNYVDTGEDTGGSPGTPQPPSEGGSQEIQKEYSIQKAEMKYGTLKITFNKELPRKYSDQVKKITVNGESFENPQMTVTWMGEMEPLDDRINKAGEKNADNISVILEFKDGSILKLGETAPPPQPPADGGSKEIEKEYRIEKAEGKYGTLKITFNKELPKKYANQVKKITVNGKEFENPEMTVTWMGEMEPVDPRINEGVVNDKKYSVILEFKDGSILRYEAEGGSITPPPAAKIADSYTLNSLEIVKNTEIKGLLVELDAISTTDAQTKIKQITVDTVTKQYSNHAFKFNQGKILLEEEEFFNAVKAKGSSSVRVAVTFIDGSVSEKNLVPKISIEEGNTPGPSNPGEEQKLADKYKKILEVAVKQGFSGSKEFQIKFSKTFDRSDVEKVDKIIVNQQEFPVSKSEFGVNFDGNLYDFTKNPQLIAKAEEKTPISLIVHFKDGSILQTEGAVQPPPTPQPPDVQPPGEGIAGIYVIEDIRVSEEAGEPKSFKVYLDKEFISFHLNSIRKIQVNGMDFEIDQSKVTAFNKLLTFKGDDIVEQAKKETPIRVIITFSDGSQLKKNVVDAPPQPGLTLDSVLQDGDYTLTFKTYVAGKGQTEESTLSHYFDERAKLHVQDGKKTVTFLNHKFASLIIDLAMQKDSGFVSLNRHILENTLKNEPKYVEYSIELEDLKGVKNIAVLGSGPMGGSETDKGNYDGGAYKKSELVFEQAVTAGWKNYKVIEDIELQKQKNAEKLTAALIANGLDTDSNGEISTEELRNAKGQPKVVADYHLNNVLDLEGLKLTDISILKDLGPNIRAINLDGNSIENLPVLEYATSVTHMFLGGNKIRDLKPNTFSAMPSLEYVDFDGSSLGDVPQGIFSQNPKLKVLSLMNANVTSLPADLIKHNPNLTELYLSENNLTELADDFFTLADSSRSSKLRRVVLTSNKLENLPSSLADVRLLSSLEASHNRIEEIPASFTKMKTLQTIDLEDNNLREIPEEFLVNLIKYSKVAPNGVRLDLTLNRLKSLPLDAMTAALGEGKKLAKFEVNKNDLPAQLTQEEKEKYEALGVKFSDYVETYFPQNANSMATVTASNGEIKLNREFDILELSYWDLGDSSYFGGQNVFESAEEFKRYLMGKARSMYDIDKSAPRDQAIQKILSKKGLSWKLETVVTKNDGQELFRELLEGNPKDVQNQSFMDPNMKTGDRYSVTKTMYVKNIYGWIRALEIVTTGVASTDAQINEGDILELSVKINQQGKDELSVANSAINPIAKLVKENGKFKYTIQLKPMRMGPIEGRVTEFNVFKNGVKTTIEPVEVGGQYPKAYTFELDQKVDKVQVSFKVDAMEGREVMADLVFSDKPSTPQPDGVRTVKAYILSADKKKPSMADGALVREVTLTPVDGGSMYDVAVEFKEMTIQGITSGVESFSIKTMEQKVPATKVEGKKGMFTFKLPKHLVLKPNSTRDTELNLEMTTYPKMPGHEKPYDVWMVLDWNGDFKFPDSNMKPPTPSPGDNSGSQEEYSVDVWMKSTDGGVSVGNKALSSTAKVVKNGSNYRYTIWLNPIDLDMNGKTLRGTITSFSVRGQEIEPNGNAYTFELDEKVNELEVSFVVDVMEELGVGSKDAYIVFNWDGSNSKPSGESPGPSFGGGGGAGPAAPVKPVLTPNQPAVTAEQALNKAAKILALPAQEKKYYSAKTLKKIEAALEAQKKGEEGALKQLETVLEEARIERITSILEEGYMTGYPNKEFKPNGTMSRAEASIMFAKLIEDEAAKMEKTDIKDGVWYSDSVNKMASLGYLKAIEDGKYNPEGKITRAEYAFLLAKLRNLPVGNQSFGDVAKDHWASDAIAACKEAGIIVGYADGSFKPDGEITRAEAVVMIQSTFDVKAKEGLKEAFNDVPKDHWAYNAIMTASKK